MQLNAHERAQHFDAYIESVDRTLRAAEISDKLGEIATNVLWVNEHTFLPNIRGDEAVVPRKYREDFDATPILPFGEEDFGRSDKVLHNIITEYRPLAKFISGDLMRSRDGANWSKPNAASCESIVPTLEETPTTIATHSTTGHSFVKIFGLTLGHTTSRTAIAVHTSVVHLGLSDWDMAANISHEESHAWDWLENPIGMRSPRGMATSELRAYHISDVLHRMSSDDASGSHLAKRVEDWRMANLGEGNFVPGDEHLAGLHWL